MSLSFFVTNILLGVGLSMDAFTVSIANSLAEPDIKKRRAAGIAGTFAFFQAFMPMMGWVCVHTIVEHFMAFEKFIPYIALLLLLFIGGNMIRESLSENDEVKSVGKKLGFFELIIQGIATSIDALSVGFTIADLSFTSALVASLIIAAVTMIICSAGIIIGKYFGTRLSGKAEIVGGIILILISIEIFIKGIM